jgi:hypothetical protein
MHSSDCNSCSQRSLPAKSFARDTAELALGTARVRIFDTLIAEDHTPGDPAVDAQQVSELLNRPPTAHYAMFVGHIIPFGLIVQSV